MNDETPDLDEVAKACGDFLQQFRSLQLATASSDGLPEASYAPFYRHGRDFYIYVSELSRHTTNLAENPRAGVMLIESEADASQVFARRRLTYSCQCAEIIRASEQFEQVMDAMQARFGNFIGMLRTLQDFHLYRLTPTAGTYVAGFAKAFRLGGDELDRVEHIDVAKRPADDDAGQQRE